MPAPALGPDAYLKLETLQPTGSFKVRGALAALARRGAAGAGVVTASAGNHALGMAWAAAALGVRATVVVPETASPAKLAALERLPVELVRHGAGYDEAEAHALDLRGRGRALRLAVQRHGRDRRAGDAGARARGPAPAGRPLTVVCAVGGGGLAVGPRPVGGRAGRARRWSASRRSAARPSPHALAAGAIVPIEPEETLADGLGGNLEAGSATFALVRDHVASVAAVSEGEIEDAMRFLARDHGVVAEGAGAVAAAGVRAGRVPRREGALVVIVTGRNIALDRLARVLAEAGA